MTNAKTTQAMADVLEGFAIDESGGNIAVNEEEAWAMARLLIEAGYIHVEDEWKMIANAIRHVASGLEEQGVPFIAPSLLAKIADEFETD